MLYFWMMANRFLNDFYGEKRFRIFFILNSVMLYSTLCYLTEMFYHAYWEIRVVYQHHSYDYNYMNTMKAVVNISKQLMFVQQSATIILAASYIAMCRDDKSTTFRGTAVHQQEQFVESWIIPKSSINMDETLHKDSMGCAFSDTKTDIKTDYRPMKRNTGE